MIILRYWQTMLYGTPGKKFPIVARPQAGDLKMEC